MYETDDSNVAEHEFEVADPHDVGRQAEFVVEHSEQHRDVIRALVVGQHQTPPVHELLDVCARLVHCEPKT